MKSFRGEVGGILMCEWREWSRSQKAWILKKRRNFMIDSVTATQFHAHTEGEQAIRGSMDDATVTHPAVGGQWVVVDYLPPTKSSTGTENGG